MLLDVIRAALILQLNVRFLQALFEIDIYKLTTVFDGHGNFESLRSYLSYSLCCRCAKIWIGKMLVIWNYFLTLDGKHIFSKETKPLYRYKVALCEYIDVM